MVAWVFCCCSFCVKLPMREIKCVNNSDDTPEMSTTTFKCGAEQSRESIPATRYVVSDESGTMRLMMSLRYLRNWLASIEEWSDEETVLRSKMITQKHADDKFSSLLLSFMRAKTSLLISWEFLCVDRRFTRLNENEASKKKTSRWDIKKAL